MRSPIMPPKAPKYIIPGVPMLRWPDFWLMISPVAPNKKTVENLIAKDKKLTTGLIIIYLPPLFVI